MKTIKSLAVIAWLVSLVTLSVYGGSVSYDDAENVALNLIYSKTGEKASVNNSLQGSLITGKETHIIRLKPKGWVIVSGDDSAEPVIAWSLESSLGTINSLPSGFITWMDNAEEQIKEARNANIDNNAALEEKWKKLTASPDDFISEAEVDNTSQTTVTKGPLLISKWGQSGYYNDRCPGNSNGQQTLTGSAATAMAQIMYYHKWPVIGTESHNYISKAHEFDLSVSFGKMTYKWVEISNDNIAKIIYHAGVAVDTDYDYAASSADTGKVGAALRDYFRYISGEPEKRSDLNDTAWFKKIKTDIDKKLPIIYYNNDGYEEKDHFFVLDGYSTGLDGTTCHINWGEEGAADGWYGLDATSESSNVDYDQGAVFSVAPAGLVSLDSIDYPPKPPSASQGTYSNYVRVEGAGFIFHNSKVDLYRAESLYGQKKLVREGKLYGPPDIYYDYDTELGKKYWYFKLNCYVSEPSNCSPFSKSSAGWRGTPTAPGTPRLTATKGTSEDYVYLSWFAVTNADRYVLRRNDGVQLVSGNVLYFYDKTAIPSKRYTYYVKACNSVGCSGEGSDTGWRDIPPPPVPKTPGISASDGTYENSVLVTWNKVSYADYYVWRREGVILHSGAALGGWDHPPEQGIKYRYTVQACNKQNQCSSSSADTGYRKMSQPSVTAGDGEYENSVQITWSKVPDASEYIVRRDGGIIYTGAGREYWDKPPEQGKDYRYTVQACSREKICGSSGSDTGFEKLPKPSVKASDGKYTKSVEIIWNRVRYASKYIVRRDGVTIYSGGYKSAHYDSLAEPGKKHRYSVQACKNKDKCGRSGSDTGYRKLEKPAVWASDGRYVGSVVIAWSKVPGANKYIMRRNGSVLYTGAAREYWDKSAVSGRIYRYTVQACNSVGCGSSGADTGYRKMIPSTIWASDGLYTQSVKIKWSEVPNVAYYILLRNDKEIYSGKYKKDHYDTSAMPGKIYRYSVMACNKNKSIGCSFSAYNSGYRKLSNPSGIWASDGTYTKSVKISWKKVPYANKYIVRRDGKTLYTGGHKSAHYDSSALPGKKYRYTVQGCNSVGCGSSSPDTGYRKLATPGIWASDGKYAKSVKITWSKVSYASKYIIRRDGKVIYRGSSREYWDKPAVPGKKYRYTVQGCNSVGCGSSAYNYGHRAVPTPKTPWIWASDGTYTKSVKITWDKVSYASKYIIRRDGVTIYSGGHKSAHYNTSAQPGKKYRYTVQACNSAECSSSAYNTGYRKLETPSVSASDGTLTKSVKVTWSKVPYASKYIMRRDGVIKYTGSSREYWDTSTTSNRSYRYTVQGCNSVGCGSSGADSGWR